MTKTDKNSLLVENELIGESKSAESLSVSFGANASQGVEELAQCRANASQGFERLAQFRANASQGIEGFAQFRASSSQGVEGFAQYRANASQGVERLAQCRASLSEVLDKVKQIINNNNNKPQNTPKEGAVKVRDNCYNGKNNSITFCCVA